MKIGDIYLVKTKDEKTFPILYVKNNNDKYYCFKLRRATAKDLFKGKMEKEQRKKFKINTILLENALNAESKSVVKIEKMYTFNPQIVLKKIDNVAENIVKKCIEKHECIINFNELHKELHDIKKKIKYAQFNNQRYSYLEKREEEILNILNYNRTNQSAHSLNTRKNNVNLKHRGINKNFYSM